MVQGVKQRPKTKKELQLRLFAGEDLSLEATSPLGHEYDGPISLAPDGPYYVVGPDPYTSRKWYAQLIVKGGKVERIV